MPPRDELKDQDVLAHLGRAREPLTLREMAHALDLRHPARRELHKIISRLKRRGDVEEVRSGHFRLAGKKTTTPPKPQHGIAPRAGITHPQKETGAITGRLVAHRDGYGFVVPDEPVPGMEGDLFIGRENLGDAMHGDRVAARIERRGQGTRGGRAEGR
ncbi:MAG: hypothetical protein ACHP79_10890, partial [Terriglobales bacterium]